MNTERTSRTRRAQKTQRTQRLCITALASALTAATLFALAGCATNGTSSSAASSTSSTSGTSGSVASGTSSVSTNSAARNAASSMSGSAKDVPDAIWQDLANQATRALKVGAVYVDVRPTIHMAKYSCREMRIELGTNRPAAIARATLAHELGHHVLRHCGQSPAQEMDANALAVTIMEDVWGDTPAQGRDFIARRLYANRNVTWNNVHDTCAELRDLLRRYPTTTDPRKPGECGA